ncbi:MAG: sulfatase [Planctomycetota bacterium]
MKNIVILFTLYLLTPFSELGAVDVPAKKPNILWLIAEDFGQHLGCFGTKEVWTPNIDRLAGDGVLYTRFYAGMVCSVSRSSFMTGMHATSIGAQNHRTVNKQPLPEGVRVLTGWLRDAGYFSANVVEMPASCGFKGTGKTDWNFVPGDKAFDSSKWSDLKEHQPFYAQVNFQETHRTFHAPKKADPAKVEIPPYYPDHPITRADWAEYLDSATALDVKVGKILEALKADGLADNTIIVFFGDNGQAHVRGKQFCYEEGFLAPLLIYYPKDVPAPAHFKAGTRDARMINGIDLAPTMLDMVGAAKPAKMQGRVFLGDHCEPDPEYSFGYRDRCDMTVMRIRSVRDTRWRYIRNFTPWVPFLAYNDYKTRQYPVWTLLPKLHAEGKLTPSQEVLCQSSMPEEELYDMENDPWELNNLAKSETPANQEALKRLRGVLEKWIVDTNDHGRTFEPLGQLKAADPRFVPSRDWRPQPGTKEAAEAEALRAAAKDQPPVEEPPVKKKKKAQ